MKLLITGFEPFGGEKINPSWEAVRGMGEIPGTEVTKLHLPVEWDRAQAILQAKIHELNPDCVLMCGQAGGRAGVTIERVAINLCETAAPDNEGVTKIGEPVEKGGPDAYFATYPYRAMLDALKAAEIPSSFSFSAGAYLCNCVMYRALHMQATVYPSMQAGFIHLPYLPEQTQDKPSLPLEVQTKAIEVIASAIAAAK